MHRVQLQSAHREDDIELSPEGWSGSTDERGREGAAVGPLHIDPQTQESRATCFSSSANGGAYFHSFGTCIC